MLSIHVESGSCNAQRHLGHLFMIHPSLLQPPHPHAYRCSHPDFGGVKRGVNKHMIVILTSNSHPNNFRIPPGASLNNRNALKQEYFAKLSDCGAVKMTLRVVVFYPLCCRAAASGVVVMREVAGINYGRVGLAWAR